MTNIFTFTCFLCKSGAFKLYFFKKPLKITFLALFLVSENDKKKL